jgi:hypothetical protein
MLTSLLTYIPLWSLLNRVIFNGLYYFCEPIFSKENIKLEKITSNIVSSYHGMKCVQLTINEYRKNDILFTYYPENNYESVVAFSISYFIYDILNDYRNKTLTSSFFIHHSLSIFSGLYLSSVELSQLYVVALFVELSNLNLNIKDIMDILEMKNLDFYTINGILFSITFFISRVVYGPIALRSAYILTNEVNTIEHRIHYNIPVLLSGSFITLNLFWFQKIVKIVIYKYNK